MGEATAAYITIRTFAVCCLLVASNLHGISCQQRVGTKAGFIEPFKTPEPTSFSLSPEAGRIEVGIQQRDKTYVADKTGEQKPFLRKVSHLEAPQSDGTERSSGLEKIQAATKAQVEAMCVSSRHCCWYIVPPEIFVQIVDQCLPMMLQYLKQNRLKLVGQTLVLTLANSGVKAITRIGANYALEMANGSTLVLSDFYYSHLFHNTVGLTLLLPENMRRIDFGFFEKLFPKTKRLHVSARLSTGNQRPLPALRIGFLPKLKYFYLDYPINGSLSGCTLPVGETACFADNMTIIINDDLMKRLKISSNLHLQLVDFHLPRKLKTLKINLHKAVLVKMNSLEGVSIKSTNIEMTSTAQIAGLNFVGAVIHNVFRIEGGSGDDMAHLTKHFDGILHSPTIAKMWLWKIKHTTKIRMPVVFGTAANQQFQDLNVATLAEVHCPLARDIIKFHNQFSKNTTWTNPKNPRISKTIRVIRGFYIDITKVIDEAKSSTFDEMEVTAFHVHVSSSRTVPYKLSVSYIKISVESDSAIFTQYRTNRRGSRFVASRGSFGTELKWSDSVDSVFMLAFKTCTAILIAQERNLRGTDNSKASIAIRLWLYKLPTSLKGTDRQIAKAQDMVAKVGELMEYWKEAAFQKAMKVPYLSLEYYQDNMAILLQMAENLLLEKQKLQFSQSFKNLGLDILNKQDMTAISLLNTEYKRTTSLVMISMRRAGDIEKKLNATSALIEEVSATFNQYRATMEAANSTFMAGVRRAQAFAYADVAAAITSSVISFFSGGFSPGKIAKAAKKAKDLAMKVKKLKKLAIIFQKLGRLIKTLRNIKELSRKATRKVSGRIARLFSRMKRFRRKRDSYLAHLLKHSKSYPFKIPLLLRKQQENKAKLEKYKERAIQAKKVRKSIDYLKDIMEGIVDAEKAKVTLANAFEEGPVQDVGTSSSVSEQEIERALQNDFVIARADQRNELKELTKTLRDYESGESKKVMEEGEKLNAADVLEWDAANANIEGTMDASLSIDIPETTEFKAALLKMNVAGRLKTQAMIDEAVIRVDLDRARFETTTYIKEGVEILEKVKQVKAALKKRKQGKENVNSAEFKKQYNQKIQEEILNRNWREFNVKLNILIGSLNFCSAYYYFHLSECPHDHIFDFNAKLRDIIYQQRELQHKSVLQLEDFYPPPQTMRNRSMTFTEPNNTCKCMAKVKQERKFKTLYRNWLNCAKDVINSTDASSVNTKRQLLAIDRACEFNKVSEMKELNRISVPITIDDKLASCHSRVRVDEIKVFLHGARTNNGVFTLSIESSGLSQDRYKDRVYDFYGDKWLREFSYYSPQGKTDFKSNNTVIEEIHVLNAADVYQSFKGVYRTSTLFTTWIVKIDPERNPGLDLSRLHRIDLQFSGSFVAADYSKLAIP